MAKNSSFSDALQEVVGREPDHPFVEKWARGEISHEAIAGAAAQHWHWLDRIVPETFLNIARRAPEDVIEMELNNYREETDPANPHVGLIKRFAGACGLDSEALEAQEPLPTTEALVNWQTRVTNEQDWIAGIATIHIASESQVPILFNKILPALRETYKFSEHDLEYWWLHAEVDVEHGGHAFAMLERHCESREDQERAVHYARQASRMKWLFWDGINLHYDVGYKLQ